jgi:hypothetical protein
VSTRPASCTGQDRTGQDRTLLSSRELHYIDVLRRDVVFSKNGRRQTEDGSRVRRLKSLFLCSGPAMSDLKQHGIQPQTPRLCRPDRLLRLLEPLASRASTSAVRTRNTCQLWTWNNSSAISHQPSAISHQPSAIDRQPSTINHRPSTVNRPAER